MSFSTNLKCFYFLTLFFFFSGSTVSHAQDFPHALFWEISGGGLNKPSYILGTIHTKDKRVFKLGDSVMIKLNECPAAVFELDLDSAKQEMLKAKLNEAKSTPNQNNSSNSSEKYFTGEEEQLVRKGLAKITGMKEDEVDITNPTIIYFIINQFKFMKGEMNEVLDQRLFNFAKAIGKTPKGIETFDEQMNAFSSMEDTDMKKAILNELNKLDKADSVYKALIDSYCAQDLEKINEIVKQGARDNPDLYYKLFDERNVKMTDRIARIAASGPAFFALGAGHLHGDNGLISLLKKKGFSLRPVYPTYSDDLAEKLINFNVEDDFNKIVSREGAFEVGFPNEPVYDIRKMPIEGTSDSLDMHIWASLNSTGNSSFIAKYNDMGIGRYLNNDSLYLELNLQASLSNSNGTLVYKKLNRFLDCPAIEYKINVMNHMTLKVIQFLRGSRDYAMIATQEKFDSLLTEKFYSSFRFLDFIPVEWKSFSDSSKSFSIDFPDAALKTVITEVTTPNDKYLKNYMVSDTHSGQSYILQEEMFSDYMQWKDVAEVFSAGISCMKGEKDSVVSKTSITWDGMPAMDVIIKSSITQNTKRVRYVLNGQKLYWFFSCAPDQWLNNAAADRFYNSFKVAARSENPNMIFEDKCERLLNDLASSDAGIRNTALQFLPNQKFQEKNLPQIYSLLKKVFDDDTSSEGVRGKLFEALTGIKDSTKLGFISDLYPELPVNSPLPVAALVVLSEMDTEESASKMKELLLSHPPEAREVDYFLTSLNEEKADFILPDILKFLEKDNFKNSIYYLINARIDSLPKLKNDLQAFEALIKKDFSSYASKRASADSLDTYDDLLHNIAGFIHVFKKDSETDNILSRLAADSSGYLSLPSAMAQVRLNGKCDLQVLERLAGDKYTRSELFLELQNINKEKLFPEKYKTKDKMAESDMYTTLVSDNTVPAEIILIDQKEMTWSGEKGIFYLYRFNLPADESKWYLGISGPQPAGTKAPVAYAKATNSFYKEYNGEPITDELWKDLLPEE